MKKSLAALKLIIHNAKLTCVQKVLSHGSPLKEECAFSATAKKQKYCSTYMLIQFTLHRIH